MKTDKKSVLWVDEAMGSDLSSVREFECHLDERGEFFQIEDFIFFKLNIILFL